MNSAIQPEYQPQMHTDGRRSGRPPLSFDALTSVATTGNRQPATGNWQQSTVHRSLPKGHWLPRSASASISVYQPVLPYGRTVPLPFRPSRRCAVARDLPMSVSNPSSRPLRSRRKARHGPIRQGSASASINVYQPVLPYGRTVSHSVPPVAPLRRRARSSDVCLRSVLPASGFAARETSLNAAGDRSNIPVAAERGPPPEPKSRPPTPYRRCSTETPGN